MTRVVAVLGTGKIGGGIARRLKTGGFQISIWDRTRSKAEALDVGRVAGSPADAVRNSDLVISMLTGPEACARSTSVRRALSRPPAGRPSWR